MRTTIDQTTLKENQALIMLLSIEKESKIYNHRKSSIEPIPTSLIREKLILDEIYQMLKNIKQLGTHDPNIVRKQAAESYENLLFS